METNFQKDPAQNGSSKPGKEVTNDQSKNSKKKYHFSAMYAASKWHGTINHVKPHSGQGNVHWGVSAAK